jgi:signal transduction histidine kinase
VSICTVTAPQLAPPAFWRFKRGWLATPVFADAELSQRAGTFHAVALTTLAIENVLIPIAIAAQPAALLRGLFSIAFVNSLVFTALALNRRGRTRLASWLYVGLMLVQMTILATTAGGIRSPGIQAYFIFVMLAGLLLGERAGLMTAFVCVLLGLGLVLLESAGVISAVRIYGAPVLWLLTCAYIGIALMTMRLATGAVRKSLARAEGELAEHRATALRLRERVKELRLLHEAARVLRERPDVDREVIQEIVARMPPAWLHVDDCRARITYQEMDVSSPGWHVTPWRLAKSFETQKGQGTVEVVYLTEQPLADHGPFLSEERALLDSLVELLHSHIERRATEEQRRMLEAQLRQSEQQAANARFAAMLDERTRIAFDLHDTLLQGFTGVGLKLVAVANAKECPPATAAELREVITVAQRTLEGARRAIWDMSPAQSPDSDFAATLRTSVEESLRGFDLRHEFVVEGASRPASQAAETALFRVTLEAIANAVKHAAARTVRIVLTYEETRIHLTVTDDGCGFVVDPEFRSHGGHLGLLGMRERAGRVNGTLTVRSTPGSGTEINLLIPLSAANLPSGAVT